MSATNFTILLIIVSVIVLSLVFIAIWRMKSKTVEKPIDIYPGIIVVDNSTGEQMTFLEVENLGLFQQALQNDTITLKVEWKDYIK